ncbi:MAG: serine/threonine protein kinase, partial [Deltaproteobacteria bacterium]
MAELIGKTFGNYRIEACLGRGGMAQVYQAQHLFLSRKVAIKIMFENLAADERFQARFHQEANTIAMLKHPNIVEIYDFGNADGALYLVMELMRAGSLRTLIERERAGTLSLSLETWLDLMRQAAEGLDFAHQRGMVHRDIKPDNFLLDPIPGQSPLRYQVKISDFGLVRLREGGVKTTPGFLMGTPAYMSPEQCEATRELDARSDIYSLGVVLYEVVTGRMPFDIRTPAEAITKHLFHHPLPPRNIWPDLPKDLEGIILRCLVKDPDRRYPSAMALARDLSALVESGRYADLRRSAILPHCAFTTPLPQEGGSSSPASGMLSGSSSNAWEETVSLVAPSDPVPIGTPRGTPARSHGAISEEPTGSLHQGWPGAMPSDVPPGNATPGVPSPWREPAGIASGGEVAVSSRTARAFRPRIGGVVILSLLFVGVLLLLLRWEDFPRRREAEVTPIPAETAREAPPPTPPPSP